MMSPPFQAKPTWSLERMPEAAPKQMCVLGEIISSSCVQYCFIAHTKTNEKQLRATQQSHCEKVHLPPVPYTSSVSESVQTAAEHQAEQTAEREGEKKRKPHFYWKELEAWELQVFPQNLLSIHPSISFQSALILHSSLQRCWRASRLSWVSGGGQKRSRTLERKSVVSRRGHAEGTTVRIHALDFSVSLKRTSVDCRRRRLERLEGSKDTERTCKLHNHAQKKTSIQVGLEGMDD